MAVELAKLSLWLATMQLGQPLSFLDHHLKQGNSLLGASLEEIEALLKQDDFSKPTAQSVVAEAKGQYMLVNQVRPLQQKIGEANTLLQKIANQIVTHAEDIHQQELDFKEVEKILEPYKRTGDLLVAQTMGLKIPINELQSIAKAYIEEKLLSEKQVQWQTLVIGIQNNKHPFHWELEFPVIFWNEDQKGFDCVVGNPPFLGGKKISTQLGAKVLKYLKMQYAPTSGAADLCAYFFRLSYKSINMNGMVGLVATNTISQGDTRETGLAVLIDQNAVITDAERFVKWGGDANVEVNLVVFSKFGEAVKNNHRTISLDGLVVPSISSWLDDWQEKQPLPLAQNKARAFNGDFLHSNGFVVDIITAQSLIHKNSKNQDCLFPYLSGVDVNKNQNQKSERYAICFHDWTLEQASSYPELMQIVREKVKPERDKVNRETHKKNWWLYGDYRKGLRRVTAGMSQVLVRSMVSEHHILTFVPNNQIFSIACVIFAYDDFYHFAMLQSWIHEVWLRRQASTMQTDIRYTPTDCFQTFPFPQNPLDSLKRTSEQDGQAFYDHRQSIMQQRQLGLTKTYNLFNNPICQDEDIQQMRLLQTRMDHSILACYGWEDIDLQHDFYPNDRKKIRFTPSPAAQREIFTRLIVLNQEIAAQEAAQGLVVEAGEEDEMDEDTEA